MMKPVTAAVLSVFLGLPLLAQTGNSAASKAKSASSAAESISTGEPVEAAAPQSQEDSPSFAPVLWVSSVETLSTTHGPQVDFIRVRGVTSTEGWQSGELIPISKGPSFDGILDLIFVADPPSDSTTPVPFPSIEAVFTMEPGHPYKGVRVHSATNRITVKSIPGYVEGPPPPDDCSKCIGKYFVGKGETAPAGVSATDIVREESLPKRLHVIRATEGVGKLDSDPNRLTLVLSEEGRIVIAAWD
jgi:hypothetical protein